MMDLMKSLNWTIRGLYVDNDLILLRRFLSDSTIQLQTDQEKKRIQQCYNTKYYNRNIPPIVLT